MALESEFILRVDQAKESLGELSTHGKASLGELGEKGGKEFSEKFAKQAEGIKARLEGVLGAVGLGLGGKELFDLGMKGKETEQQLAISMAGIGLHGKEAEEAIKKIGEAAETNGNKYGIPVEKLKDLTGKAIFLGQVSPETGSKLALVSAGIEKMTNGLIPADAALRGLLKPAGPEGQATIGRLAMQFPALGKALEGVTDPSQRAEIAMKTLGSQFGALADATKTPLGKINALKEGLEDAMINIGGHVVDVIGTIIGLFSNLPGPLQKVIEVVGGVAAAFIAYNVVANLAIVKTIAHGVAEGAATIAKIAGAAATGVATAAQWLWNAAMDANPIGLIVIGIAALIAGIVLLIQHFKQVTDAVKSAWNWLGSLFGATKNAIDATKEHTTALDENTAAQNANNAAKEAAIAADYDALVKAQLDAAKTIKERTEAQVFAKTKDVERMKKAGQDAEVKSLEASITLLKKNGASVNDLMHLYLALAEAKGDKKQKEKPEKEFTYKDELGKFDEFIAGKAAHEEEGRAKELDESRKDFDEKQKELKKLFDEYKITTLEWQTENDKLTDAGRKDEAAINKKYDDEEIKSRDEINEKFRLLDMNEQDRKLARLEDERKKEVEAAKRVGADVAAINKYYDEQERELTDKESEATLAVFKSLAAGTGSVMKQGLDAVDKNFEKSFANNKTVVAQAAVSMEKSLSQSAEQMASKAIAPALSAAAGYIVAAIASAYEWVVSLLGPWALPVAVGLGAGIIGAFASQKKNLGFEHGGIGASIVGERGPEIIAPMKDYSQGFAELTNQITNTLHEGLANVATNINVQGHGVSKVTMTGGQVQYVQQHEFAHSASVTA